MNGGMPCGVAHSCPCHAARPATAPGAFVIPSALAASSGSGKWQLVALSMLRQVLHALHLCQAADGPAGWEQGRGRARGWHASTNLQVASLNVVVSN